LLSLRTLAKLVRANPVRGPVNRSVSAAADLPSAGPRDLSFLRHPPSPSSLAAARKSRAGVLLTREPVPGFRGTQLVVKDPVAALSLALEYLYPDQEEGSPVHPAAVIAPSARLGSNCRVEAGAVIEADCVLGRDCRIMAGAVLRHGCRLGRRVVIGPHSVVGGSGFGFAESRAGYRRLRHVGTVEIGDDTEIGAGCTVDRALLGTTRLGRGVKLDDQVHIGHNAVIGDYTAFAAQVGVGGSTVVGKRVKAGGQAGIADHLKIGAGAIIGAQAGVTKDVPAGAFWTGNPARDVREKRREQALLRSLARPRPRGVPPGG
jgi:UDP-3-O-[3-hydroxymyristoyl] glucosamine N-acyltransferase